jgi:broad specificity phosphatase PhoE
VKKLFFMRHGQSEANAAHRYAAPETPLSELGRQQASAAGLQLKAAGIDLIISSDLRRAVETAEIVADQLGYDRNNILVDNRLREVGRGDLVGAQAGGLSDYRQAAELPGNPHQVETEWHLEERMADLLAEVKQRPEEHILLVGHQDSGLTLEDLIRREQHLPELLNLENAKPSLVIGDPK